MGSPGGLAAWIACSTDIEVTSPQSDHIGSQCQTTGIKVRQMASLGQSFKVPKPNWTDTHSPRLDERKHQVKTKARSKDNQLSSRLTSITRGQGDHIIIIGGAHPIDCVLGDQHEADPCTARGTNPLDGHLDEINISTIHLFITQGGASGNGGGGGVDGVHARGRRRDRWWW